MAQRAEDAISLLEADHKKVKALFRDFEAAGERASVHKQQLFATIQQELVIHTTVEEEIFYPGVKAEAEDMIAEALEEHHVVDTLLTEIGQLNPSDEAFTAKMTVMIENVEHHAEEEEKELFPKVKKALGMEKMRELGQQMARRKQELQRAA
jgi:hemerythrin superfamily protein